MAFFADGLCEELANALGRLDEFDKIPPWSSSSTFRQDVLNKKQVAEDMQVSTLLEGSVKRIDDHCRISATLVDPFHGRSGNILWSETYDHDHTTALLFDIQDEIARSIVEKLRVELEDNPNRQFVRRDTESPEAYDCYLKGRYALIQRDAALEKAKHWFELALLYDSPTGLAEASGMATAYVGLADAYHMQVFYGDIPAREGAAKGRKYVERALEIDDQMAEAYATLGWAKMQECDGVGADQAFRRAIALDDQLISARLWYATLLTTFGDFEKAREQAGIALKLDPVSPGNRTISAWQFTNNRGWKDALDILDKVIEEYPEYALAHFVQGRTYLDVNEPDKAILSCVEAVRLSGGRAMYRALLASAYGAAAQRDKARKILAELESESYLSPQAVHYIAEAHLFLDEKERFYQIFEAQVSETGGMPFLTAPPSQEALFAEERFIKLVNDSGLLKYNPATETFELNTASRTTNPKP